MEKALVVETPRSESNFDIKKPVSILESEDLQIRDDFIGSNNKINEAIDEEMNHMKEDLLELVKTEEELLEENMRVISKLQIEPSNINVNIKYNIMATPKLINHTGLSIKAPSIPDPILHLIDNVVDITDDDDETKEEEFVPEAATPTETTASLPIITTDLVNNKDLYAATNGVTDAAATGTATAAMSGSHGGELHKKLTPTDYLRLCFTKGVGCDFSFNREEPPTSTEPNTTPSSTGVLLSSSTTTVKSTLSARNEEKLRERVKLCFFSSICDGNKIIEDDNNDDQSVSSILQPRQPRVITTTESPTRMKIIKKLVQEKARACLFEGIC